MRSRELAGALLVLLALAAGCAQAGPTTPSPEPTSSTPTSASPSAAPRTSSAPPVSTVGVGGMDVRYLDEDGQIKTLRVEDFPR